LFVCVFVFCWRLEFLLEVFSLVLKKLRMPQKEQSTEV
jgi:hypothetical protein